MKRKCLAIGISTITVVLLVLGSLSNVVGIENVQGCDCGDPPCWPEISGIMGDNNWYVGFFTTVTFNGTFNYVYYRIDGSNWINYTGPFTLRTEGIHLLEWTCDSNMSNISSLEIKIDWAPPEIGNYTVERVGLLKWQFRIDASDEISGVNAVQFNIPRVTDTEPPYEVIWRGCAWFYGLLDSILTLLFNWWTYPFDAWDNAGNHIFQPHTINVGTVINS